MDIFGKEEMSTFLKLRTKEKKEIVDKDKEDEIAEYLDKKNKVCPRCGHTSASCNCKEKDFYSTINSYRIPKGNLIKLKENKDNKNYIITTLKEFLKINK
jgi:ribosomal protein S27AE